MLNIANIIREGALRHKEKIAIFFGDTKYTFAQLDVFSNKIASFLKEKGVQKGDRVALSCPNIPYFPMVYYGILKMGGVVVPHNVLLKGPEIEYLLNDCKAKAYFAFEGSPELPMGQMAAQGAKNAPLLENLIIMTANPTSPSPIENTIGISSILANSNENFNVEITQPQDTAVILYTSGTTGKPKGAELTQFNVFMNTLISRDLFCTTVQDNNVFMMVLPLFHSFGQIVGMNANLYSGAPLVMLPRFDAAQTLGLMLLHNVTTFAGVPTMYWALINEAAKLPPEKLKIISNNLKVCASGGAALPVEIHQQFKNTFGVSILEGYGLSETSPVASFHHQNRPLKVGSIGEPVWGVEMKIFDDNDKEVAVGEVGEIVIRGHNIMKGYFNRPEETEKALKNGWFHSGDMGKMDEDGYFYVVDRLKDMIIRGGYNIYPREIEETLLTYPQISLAAVIGIPHSEHGEEVKAFVVPKEEQTIDIENLISWCKDNMAAYKYPRFIEVCDSLPMNATGKVLKTELRKT